MKRWEPYLHGATLALSLGLCWSIWKHEEPAEKSSVTVLEIGDGSLESLEWDDGKSVATVSFTGKEESLETWVTAGRRKKLPKAPQATPAPDSAVAVDGATPAPTPAEPTPKPGEEDDDDATYGEPELRSFPGNDQAEKLADGFTPLVALRQFDNLGAESLKEMGLDTPEGTLVVRAAGREHRFEVGDKAYGSNDNYLRVAGGGPVYLVSSTVLGPLRGADNRLVERDPFGVDLADVARLVVSTPAGPGFEAVHAARHDKTNSFWAQPATPEQKDAALDGFVDKLLSLRVTTYPTEAEKAESAGVETVFSARVVGDTGDLSTVQIGRKVDVAKSKPDEVHWAFYGRTPRTRDTWVVVSKATAQELADSLPNLTGAPAAP